MAMQSRTKRNRDAEGGLAAANKRDDATEKRRRGAAYQGPQMTWHYKPNKGGPKVTCDVCGALGLREGARHRALAFGETRPHPAAVYVRSVKVAFGQDWEEYYLDSHGKEVK